MILFRKTLKTSIFSIITFWITLTSCEFYCDDNVGICIYNKYRLRLDHAIYECKLNGSIILEIYDDNYKEVTIKALQKFDLEYQQILFGLVYKDGQFQWLSKREVKVRLNGMDGFHSDTDCNFFLKSFQSHLRVEATCSGGTPVAYFVCLKEFNRSSTLPTTTNIVIPNNSPSNFINNNQLPDNNYDQLNELQKKIIGIGVGVVLSLILVVVVVLGIYFFRSPKNGQITNVAVQMNQNHQCAITDYLELIEDESVNTDYLEVIEDEQVNTDYLEVIGDEQVNTDYLELIEDENVYTDLAQDHHHYESLKVHK